MSITPPNNAPAAAPVRVERTFQRFTLGQRWEHAVLILCITVLLLTGLPQKYRDAGWSQWILSTPERVDLIQQIHHIAALVLTAEVLYHLGRAFYLISRRRLPGDMLPNLAGSARCLADDPLPALLDPQETCLRQI